MLVLLHLKKFKVVIKQMTDIEPVFTNKYLLRINNLRDFITLLFYYFFIFYFQNLLIKV